MLRPELVMLAVTVVGMLLVEVWQSSRVAELSLGLDQSRAALEQAHARLDFMRSDLERRTTRAVLVPKAEGLGLAPLDARQIVLLPSEFLPREEEPRRSGSTSLLAWAGRVSRVLVPEATARSRQTN